VELVRETIQDMEGSLKEGQHIDLYIEVAAGAWGAEGAGSGPRIVRVDVHLLRNVLNNLLSNAIKYSAESAAIDCVLTYLADAVEIGIRDRGIGIPAAEQEQLFERFFRASNSTGISGTGLGLSIVKRYLDLMGGEIGLTSVEGGGSTFTVTLPV
jgi:signal transduction histidine kinase